jgi:acyl-CoA synthetase (AMP-forming)/AMP-acid ligase II/thioesterase domain-containing protein/acyl carrier protein
MDELQALAALDLRRCTVRDMVAVHARIDPEAVAVVAPGRAPLTYGRLLSHVDDVIATLNGMGIGRNDAVALVLPPGPEMAVAWLAVAAMATAAPLNPMYRGDDFDLALVDFKVRAVIVERGSDLPVVGVARARGIPIIELSAACEAGLFTLTAPAAASTQRGGAAQPSDVALVLHTSGTTGQPKVVPLTQSNVVHGTCNFIDVCRLKPADRGLVVVPQFHVAVLSTVLAPLFSGGSLVCLPGLDPTKLAGVMEAFQPTWYVAVPAVHQALRAQLERAPQVVANHSLRFIATAGAAMPAATIAEMEGSLRVPVLQLYGLTETSSVVTCNPLPPAKRKAGSVGIAINQEVAIMDDRGNTLPVGESGEVMVRGANVMAGYRDDPQSNGAVFRGDWFRSGDLGHIDEDGFLWLSGRLKDMINRGGQKISPFEVDQALLTHPDVVQAAAFSMPDERLGEDVAAAVVLRPGAAATGDDLRAYAAERLPYFKVPRRIVVLDELPRGPTGKIVRTGLAEQLGVVAVLRATAGDAALFVAPRTPTEEALAKIFADVLGVDRVGIHDDFFAVGGDSLMGITLFNRIEEEFGRAVAVTTLFEHGTVADLASALSVASSVPGKTLLVPIRAAGAGAPFICIHGAWGDVFYFRRVAQSLGGDIPVYGFRMRGVQGDEPLPTSVDEMAAAYVDQLLAFDPAGPYFLGGYSFGGIVAYEMACRLVTLGRRVALLALIDSINPGIDRIEASRRYARFLWSTVRRAGSKWLQPAWLGRQIRLRLLPRRQEKLHEMMSSTRRGDPWSDRLPLIEEVIDAAARRYDAPIYPGRITLLRTGDYVRKAADPQLGWGALVRSGIETVDVPGHHLELMEAPHAATVAAALEGAIRRARREV